MSKPAFPAVFAIRPPKPLLRQLRACAGRYETRNAVVTRILAAGLARPSCPPKEGGAV